ncbi:hypothetical protein NDU88_004600 [Pleurodeles waltl]|uniref:Uncharacterized protein n=1 Tax=Pleurodeles waltl TaxID=8319 RepID=A0AAV7LIK1_PLEWA|nr:hypothetical protein NDU88_004600 [Pleurodeles waltl]
MRQQSDYESLRDRVLPTHRFNSANLAMGCHLITGSWITLVLLLAAFSDVAFTGRGLGGGGMRGGGWARSGSFSRGGSPPVGIGGYRHQGSSNQGMKMAGAAAMGAVAGGVIGYGMGSVARPHHYGYSSYGYRGSGQTRYTNRGYNDTYDFALGDAYSATAGLHHGLHHILLLWVCAGGFGTLVQG